MKVLDRVPILDREKFPISGIIDIIPRQLFNRGLTILKKESLHRRCDLHLVEPVYRYSSIYLPEIQKYAYLTGVMIRENLEDIVPESESDKKETAEVEPRNKDKGYIQLSVPKIFVLISRLPVYPEMQKGLQLLMDRVRSNSQIPLENMIKNLIFEIPYPGQRYIVRSTHWDISWQSSHLCHSKYLEEVFINNKENENIFRILENMISGIPVILVSTSVFKLVSTGEVLRSLMFPFEFQGLIIPYEPRPNLKLILSGEPFLIGLEYESYDQIKEDIGKQTVLIYDLDEKEFLTNMGVSKMTVRINKEHPSKRKKISFPAKLKQIYLNSFPKQMLKEEVRKFSDFFESFFSEFLPDTKRGNDKQNLTSKKKRDKEHKEFLELFCKTETYKSMERNLNTEEVKREHDVGKNNKYPVEPPLEMEFQDLQDLYKKQNTQSPIYKDKARGQFLYSYRCFPKLIDELLESAESVKSIRWPSYPTGLKEDLPTYDLFNPEIAYRKMNINTITWIVLLLSSYWYQESQNKIVNIAELIQVLMKASNKLEKRDRLMGINSIIHVISSFGDK